jgi:FkbM family methyltransferase
MGDVERELYVLWAYRLLLGREPENPGALSDFPFTDRKTLVRQFVGSPEFRFNNGYAAPSTVELATHDGYSIYAARDDQLIGSPVLHGSYEPHVAGVFRRYLKPGMNVLDVGANCGLFSMLAASIVGRQGLVTAIEANPDNARMLEASRRLNGFAQVRLVCAAAGPEVGVLGLDTDVSNGVTTAIGGEDELWTTQIVPSLPIRAVLPPDRPLDFVKIDIEGAEHGALGGCAEILRRDRPVIVSELSPDALVRVSGVAAEVYLGFLKSFGLELAVIARSGELAWFGDDVAGVMAAYGEAESDHIDIVAAPPSARPRLG